MTSPGIGQPITVQITDTQLQCPHCGTPALLTAHVPHGWTNTDGTQTTGTLPVPLCPECDADNPGAAPLITYFHVHGRVDAESVQECAILIQGWVAGISIPPVDLDQLEAEIRAWQLGEL